MESKSNKKTNSNEDIVRRNISTVPESIISTPTNSMQDNPFPSSNSINVKARKLSQRTTLFYCSDNVVTASSVPMRRVLPLPISRKSSLQLTVSNVNNLFPNHSASIEDNSYEFSTNIELSQRKVHSDLSLARISQSDSRSSEYIIDWKNIFKNASETVNDNIETELINYFHNGKLKLKMFHINCLYRFITFNDVLSIVFKDFLLTELDCTFHRQIMKVPTQMNDLDYDLNSYDVTKIIRCNIKKFQQTIEEYIHKKSALDESLKEVKDTLSLYLKDPEGSTKLHNKIDTICMKCQTLIDCLIIMIMSLSLWKLFNDIPDLCQGRLNETTILTNCKQIFLDIRQSERRIEKQINKLIKEFRDEKSDEVLKLCRHIFNETLEVSICLPILRYKIQKDELMMSSYESLESMDYRTEQFV